MQLDLSKFKPAAPAATTSLVVSTGTTDKGAPIAQIGAAAPSNSTVTPSTPQAAKRQQQAATSAILASLSKFAPAATSPISGVIKLNISAAAPSNLANLTPATSTVPNLSGLQLPQLPAPAASAALLKLELPASPQVAPILAPAAPIEFSAAAPSNLQAMLSESAAPSSPDNLAQVTEQKIDKYEITLDKLNPEQLQAVEFAKAGRSYCLIGSAGTGKTTTQRTVLQELAASGCIGPLPESWDHRYLLRGNPSIVITSFINKAVNNIRAALPIEFKSCALTIHKLLEYAPVYEDYISLDKDGNEVVRQRKVFRPRRNQSNQLIGITHLVIEESSTISLPLFEELVAALPDGGRNLCWIFLGDLKQLPPVMGKSILASKIQELDVVELTRIYRQASDSPVKRFAIAINEGQPITDEALKLEYAQPGKLEFVNLSGLLPTGTAKPRRPSNADFNPIINFYKSELASGKFVQFRDIILCPHRQHDPDNTANWINTDNINQHLADYHGKLRGATVVEVICGYLRKYLAVGDPITLGKRDYQITRIEPNPKYRGIPCKLASPELDRWGNYIGAESAAFQLDMQAEVQHILDQTLVLMTKQQDEDAEEEMRKTPSHMVYVIRMDDPEAAEEEIEIDTAGDINSIEFAYATTVHKSIGSEWERVYLCLHHSHTKMMFRELLYTAVSRAREYLQVIYNGQNHQTNKPNSSLICAAILNPRIKGVTLAEKLAWLRAQAEDEEQTAQRQQDMLAQFAIRN